MSAETWWRKSIGTALCWNEDALRGNSGDDCGWCLPACVVHGGQRLTEAQIRIVFRVWQTDVWRVWCLMSVAAHAAELLQENCGCGAVLWSLLEALTENDGSRGSKMLRVLTGLGIFALVVGTALHTDSLGSLATELVMVTLAGSPPSTVFLMVVLYCPLQCCNFSSCVMLCPLKPL